MTRLRQQMLEELQRRNYSPSTIRGYILAVKQFAEYFGKPPDRLGATHVKRFQWYLLQERKLDPGTVEMRMSALRFFFKKMLKRPRHTFRRPSVALMTPLACGEFPMRPISAGVPKWAMIVMGSPIPSCPPFQTVRLFWTYGRARVVNVSYRERLAFISPKSLQISKLRIHDFQNLPNLLRNIT